MNKLVISCFFAVLGIGLGAFGAHALEPTLAAKGHVDTWNTAVHYHLLHAVALFVLAATENRIRGNWAFRLWVAGIVLFSGSLYGLSLSELKFLGPITPLGGLAFMAGWIALVFENRKHVQ